MSRRRAQRQWPVAALRAAWRKDASRSQHHALAAVATSPPWPLHTYLPRAPRTLHDSVRLMYDHINPKNDQPSPLVSEEFYNTVMEVRRCMLGRGLAAQHRTAKGTSQIAQRQVGGRCHARARGNAHLHSSVASFHTPAWRAPGQRDQL